MTVFGIGFFCGFVACIPFSLLFYRQNKRKWEKASGELYEISKAAKEKASRAGR